MSTEKRVRYQMHLSFAEIAHLISAEASTAAGEYMTAEKRIASKAAAAQSSKLRACHYCKRPVEADGSIYHAFPCAGLDRVDINRLQYDALVAAARRAPETPATHWRCPSMAEGIVVHAADINEAIQKAHELLPDNRDTLVLRPAESEEAR